MEGCCTSRCCARRTRTPASSPSAASGRWRCRAWSRSSPGRTFRAGSTARPLHEDHLVDPDDTYVLDNVVRFVGQRIAAVVAETEAAAEAGLPAARRRPTRSCPPCSIRSRRWRPDAPILHDKGGAEKGNIYVDIHGEVGSVADGFAAADAVHEMTYSTSRVQHVHLETHGSIAWRGDDGRLACPHQLAGALHRAAEALPHLRSARRATCMSSPSASAAGSAASRR